MEGEEQYQKPINPIATPRLKVAKAMLFLSGLILFVFGGSLVTTGMYLQLDHGFISEIIGSLLYQAAAYTAIVAGLLVLSLGVLGALAARTERRWQLIFYLTAVLILALLVLGASILAVVFRSSLIAAAKTAMHSSLRIHYGKTRLITEAWDLTQTRLRCCAVDRSGWSAYLGSEWDLIVNSDARNLQQRLPTWSPLYKFVPRSCCLRLIDPRTLWPTGGFKDIAQCQYWPYGPPNRIGGGFNDAVYYRGCYEAGAEFLSAHSRFLAGIGFLLFLAMVVGLASALSVLANGNLEAVEFRRSAQLAYMKSGQLLLSGDAGEY